MVIKFNDSTGEKECFDLSQHGSFAFNTDCLEFMKNIPDNYFDICCADPPYGGGFTEGGGCKGWFTKYHRDGSEEGFYNRFWSKNSRFEKYRSEKIVPWDVAPSEEYFAEMFRVSKDQIIWGGNYFSLPPTRCFLVWRKLTISESFTMAMAEYAWTSFNSNAKVFECAPQGRPGDERFHPTQKPIELYSWIYRLYAKPGMKVFDPYLGSGSSRIAAYDAGLDFVGVEIDEDYFGKQEERFERHTAQLSLFVDG